MIKPPSNFKINLNQAAALTGQSRITMRHKLLTGVVKGKRKFNGRRSTWEIDFLSVMNYRDKLVEKSH